MAGIEIEIWLQESGSKLGYRNWNPSLVTGIGIEVGLKELRSKVVTGIGIKVGLGIGIEVGL